MNWNTKSFGKLELVTAINDGMSDVCSHVETDNHLAYALIGERDSFGPVCQTVVCEACYASAKAEEDNQEVVCHDCGKSVKAKDSIAWTWYDFYAPQGDEAMIVCDTCRCALSHKVRVLIDRREYLEEMDPGNYEAMDAIDDEIAGLRNAAYAEHEAKKKADALCIHKQDGSCWHRGDNPDCGFGTFNQCPLYVASADKAHGEGEPYASVINAVKEASKLLTKGTVGGEYGDKVRAFIELGLDIKRGM